MWQHVRAETRGFLLFASGRADLANAPCHGGTHIVMPLYEPRRRSVSTATTKTSKQADYQRMAHDTGARQLNVALIGVLGLGWAKTSTGRKSRGSVLPFY
jgi:hypothetical protein